MIAGGRRCFAGIWELLPVNDIRGSASHAFYGILQLSGGNLQAACKILDALPFRNLFLQRVLKYTVAQGYETNVDSSVLHL